MTALQHARFTGVNTVDYDKDPKSVKPLLAQICSIGSNVVGGNELIQWHHLKNGMLVSKKNVVPGWIADDPDWQNMEGTDGSQVDWAA